jgi:hypothetical protein
MGRHCVEVTRRSWVTCWFALGIVRWLVPCRTTMHLTAAATLCRGSGGGHCSTLYQQTPYDQHMVQLQPTLTNSRQTRDSAGVVQPEGQGCCNSKDGVFLCSVHQHDNKHTLQWCKSARG